jgi:hypothetical protein
MSAVEQEVDILRQMTHQALVGLQVLLLYY